MQIKYLPFENAFQEACSVNGKKQLLLGNGFSIGGHPSFQYGTLFEQAKRDQLPEHLEILFERYGNNFEGIMKYLDEGAYLAEFYSLIKSENSRHDMREDYENLKNVLVKTISDNHPDFPSAISDDKFRSCLSFLKKFDAVFTVNYDVLLYWASVHIKEMEGEEFPFCDGFCRDLDADNPDCSFSYSSIGSKPYIFFLHGALHLYTKDGFVWKRVWNTTEVPIITQVRAAFEAKQYPLFVAEGASIDKMKKIESSSYLSQAYRKFKNMQGHLFIFGHSLSEQDKHLLYAIVHAEGSKLNNLWIGLYDDPDSPHNRDIILKAFSLQEQREAILSSSMKKRNKGHLQIAFFDSSSARVWG